MKKHVKIYMETLGYDKGDFIPSEISGKLATDIHHINARGMGGSKDKDDINNLMALTREEHILYGDKKQYKEWLQHIHNTFLFNNLK